MVADVVIEEISYAAVNAAREIFDTTLGSGYVERSGFVRLITSRHGVALRATDTNGSTVGVVAGECLDLDALVRSVPEDQAQAVRVALGTSCAEPVGLVRSVAVRPDVQHHGIGTQLVSAAITALRQRGANTLVSLGWADDRGCHIAGVLLALAFQQRGVFDDFWFADSHQRGYRCPSCGGPCRCQAHLFVGSIPAALDQLPVASMRIEGSRARR
jgi:GNAT superfamily N-acetyltransferase